MTPTQAILIGATLISLSIVAARVIAPYEVAPGVDAAGNAFLWRTNVVTGDVQTCHAHQCR